MRSARRTRHRPVEIIAKFRPCDEARLLAARWRLHDNHRRIHRAFGKLSPAAFAASCWALSPLRLAALDCAAAPPGPCGIAIMQRSSTGVVR
jgi:hypothetical protein